MAVKISNRLRTAALMVTPGNRLADVGTDHGYVPIFLVEEKRIPSAIAMDIGKGPLERAKEHIKEAGLEAYITTRLSNGLKELEPEEADTVLIAGMGGGLIEQILSEGTKALKTVKELVLGPQSETERLRRFLIKNGYSIDREEFIQDAGKYYPFLHVVRAQEQGNVETWQDYEYAFGKDPVAGKNPTLAVFLREKEAQYQKIIRELKSRDTWNEARIAELEKELDLIKKTTQIMGNCV